MKWFLNQLLDNNATTEQPIIKMNTNQLGDWVELNLPFGNVYGPGLVELDSFSGRGLNNPGVLVRMQDGSEYLIGDINPIRGVCDDCTEFSKDAIVSAYRVVWINGPDVHRKDS